MQPPGLFHPYINRILLAGEDHNLSQQLTAILHTMAPGAVIRSTHTRHDAVKLISEWHPNLLIIELVIENDLFLAHIDQDLALPLAPFTLGVADHISCSDVALAMRYGFSDVTEKPVESDFFQRKIHSIVSRLPILPVQIGQIINPYLYSGTPIQMKKLLEDIDKCIFERALQMTSSKNGISRMLGISRQLVQYHLKKSGMPQH